MLGDNLVSEAFAETVREFERSSVGCRIFLKELPSVEGLGVACVNNGAVTKVVEKPDKFISNFVVTGIYLFDNRCFDLIEKLYPSARNELEITGLINAYIELGSCDSVFLTETWLDAGTFESLGRAAELFEKKD